MHKESVKLAKSISKTKKTISSLEKEILKLKFEYLKTEVKTLKQIDTNQYFIIKDINKVSHSCNCCDKFKVEIKDLKDSLAKFTLGKNNLDIIPGKPRRVNLIQRSQSS